MTQEAGVAYGSRASPSAIDVGLSISAMLRLRPMMRGAAICREGPTTEVAFSLYHPVGEREKRRWDREDERRSLGVLTGSLLGWSAGSSAS
jgi:hypothetical protein